MSTQSGCPESSVHRADLHREINPRSPNSRTPRIFRMWMMTQRIFWCSEFRDPLIRSDSGYFSWWRYFRVCECLSNFIDHSHGIYWGLGAEIKEMKSLEPNENIKRPGLTIVNIKAFHNLDQSGQPRQKSNVLSWGLRSIEINIGNSIDILTCLPKSNILCWLIYPNIPI